MSSAAHKAVLPDLLAPKRKHVRKLIVDTWTNQRVNLFKLFEKEGVTKNGCTAFKCLTVIHKVLQEGSPHFLTRSYNAINFLQNIQNFWAGPGGANDIHYARLISEYAYFLRGKITFHHKHPLVLGKLSLDDYKNKIKNQPEVPLQTRQQMISHLLDLQEMILRIQDTIFRFNGRDLHESKKAALVPLVVEADATLQISIHHLKELCERTNDVAQVKRYIDRFNLNYPRFRLFFDNASRIPYVTTLLQVPSLPADIPVFMASGEKAGLVPSAEQVISINSLMLDGDVAPSDVKQAPLSSSEPVNASPAISADNNASKPAGWVSFDGDQDVDVQKAQQAQAEAQRAQQAQVEAQRAQQAQVEAQRAQQAQQMQAQQAIVAEGASRQAASSSGSDAEALKALQKALEGKEGEINYWKQMCANALRQAQMLNSSCEENKQRGDELEQHLQDLQDAQQAEKEDALMRKLNSAVGNVQAALARLRDTSIPSNLSSTPNQILSAHESLLVALVEVEGAAQSRDHQELISSTKKLVAAGVEQSEHSKGVAKLTDDPELSKQLTEAAEASTSSLRTLLETIQENPYDADPIIAQCEEVRSKSILLEAATKGIIAAESVEGSDHALTDKATSELHNAARVIEEAAKTLLEAKKRAEEKAKTEDSGDAAVAGSIVSGAMAITDAIKALIEKATILQKENVEAGRTRGDGTVYKKDVAWSEGLISAASSVAASVQDLVQKADGAVSGEIENEALVVASKQVAAATTQLVISSRVRSDPESKNQKNLEVASKSVSKATRTLMIAMETEIKQETVEEDTKALLKGLSLTEVKIKEMNQQASILKLEKELELARLTLASMRKSEYQS